MSAADGIVMVALIVYVVVAPWLVILGVFDEVASRRSADDAETGVLIIIMAMLWPIIVTSAALVGGVTRLGRRARSNPHSSSPNRGEGKQRGTTR